jgi:16S rRNA (adenine1518-N6/adenine1519-N6)-dimethyltransferase
MTMSPERLGQHFLSNPVWQDRILDAIDARQGLWVEIGAGHGEMTARLAQRATRLIAVELDAPLAAQLRKSLGPRGNVVVVEADILSVDFAALTEGQPFSVYGNLPYYITSPIVHRVLQHSRALSVVHFVMQYEVALRLAAQPGNSDYGYFSVFTQWFTQPTIEFKIPPAAFTPPPGVDSALLTLRPREPNATVLANASDPEAGFFEFVKECFAHKRKTLRNNLRARLGPMTEEILISADLPAVARAVELAPRDFALHFGVVHQKQSQGPNPTS